MENLAEKARAAASRLTARAGGNAETIAKASGEKLEDWTSINEDVATLATALNTLDSLQRKTSNTSENYFAIVWAGSNLYYICNSPEMVQERLKLIMDQPHLNQHIQVLEPTVEYKNGKKV